VIAAREAYAGFAGECIAGGGKSELHRAVCRITSGSGGFKAVRRKVPQRKYRLARGKGEKVR